uniref:Uncharacterized protein n=1 Tax=Anguilla anguilla TaxID=7936 RepID=A0A0E9QXY8_ANGAN
MPFDNFVIDCGFLESPPCVFNLTLKCSLCITELLFSRNEAASVGSQCTLLSL